MKRLLTIALAVALIPTAAFARSHKATPAPDASGAPAAAAVMPSDVSCTAGDPVVWVNTSSKAYHYSSSRYYGKTKHGKYLCESAAKTAGDHATKGEKPA